MDAIRGWRPEVRCREADVAQGFLEDPADAAGVQDVGGDNDACCGVRGKPGADGEGFVAGAGDVGAKHLDGAGGNAVGEQDLAGEDKLGQSQAHLRSGRQFGLGDEHFQRVGG